MGVAAIDNLQEMNEAVGSIGLGLNHTRADVASLAKSVAIEKQSATVLMETVISLTNRLTAFEEATRTTWGRICWVFGW